MPEPITYIFFSGRQYYPEGGAGDSTVVIRAEDDEAALVAAEALRLSPVDDDWWRLDRIEGDKLTPVFRGWVGDNGLIVDEAAVDA